MRKVSLLTVLVLAIPSQAQDITKPPEAKGKYARMWEGRTWDDYWAMMWIMGSSYNQQPVEQVFWKMRELGCNSGMAYIDGRDDWLVKFFLPYYNENMFRISYCKRQKEYMNLVASYIKTRDKKYLQRQPCLDDLDWREKAKQRLVSLAKRRVPYRPVAYSIEDESSLTYFARDFDFDFSPKSLARFRLWLKERYKTLERLNAQWGSAFKVWDEVMPQTLLEALSRPDRNGSAWSDHRDYMDHAFAGCLNDFEKAIRTVDPHTPVGLVGTQMPGVSTGYNYWLLCNNLTFLEPYDVGNSIECVRSFQKLGDHRVFWATTETLGNLERATFRLWRYLLHGAGGMILWESSAYIKGSPPELTPQAKAAAPLFHELTGGIAKLLHNADRDDDPIAIHYSHAAIRGRFLLRWAETPRSIAYNEPASYVPINSPTCHAWEAWTKLIEDLGFQYRFVASAQIEAGHLLKNGYKVLVLPLSVALSDQEVAEIHKFAEAGGLVIADNATGLMDGHCKVQKSGRLDDFFGIKRSAMAIGKGVGGKVAAKGRPVAYEFNDFAFVETIQATGGTPLAESDAPGLVLKPHGKGWSCYLNTEMKNYVKLRLDKGRGQTQRDVVRSLCASAGVKPRVQLLDNGKTHPAGIETFYFKSGDIAYVALHHNHSLQQSELGEVKALAWYRDTPELTVSLPRKAFVYDVRARKFLGETDSATTRIATDQPKIYALLPYRVDGLEVDVARKDRTLTFTASVKTAGRPGLHVFHTRLLDPDGREDEAYRDNFLAPGGRLSANFLTSPNDKKGSWTFEITDIATGITGKRKVDF